MRKKAAVLALGLIFLASPVLASATTNPIEELQSQIQYLLRQLAVLKASLGGGIITPATCLSLSYDLYIGKTDVTTNGEVSKLQNFLRIEGVYPEGQVTGYYGHLTAQAVMRWQKAHGMDFVTLKSGVGKMTRAKMQESCTSWVSYDGDDFRVRYPSQTFSVVPSAMTVPEFESLGTLSGVKLQAKSDAPPYGKYNVECMYGDTQVCAVESGTGGQYVVVNKLFDELVAPLHPELTDSVMVAGKRGMKYSYGAEGDGVDHYYVQISTNKTLLISFVYRGEFGGDHQNAVARRALFNQILATVTVAGN